MAEFNWDHIRTFMAVARSGRLTVAAARMRTDHTTISRRISCLEHALKAKLFDRSPAGYSLTEPGTRLLALAEKMETTAILAAESVGGAAQAVEGVLRIAGPEGFGSYFLAPRLATLADRHPGLNIQLLAGPSIYSLSRRDADIVITLSRPLEGRVFARKLVDYELGIYASSAYLEKFAPIRQESDLRHHHFIGYINDLLQTPELNYVHKLGSDSAPRLESSNLLVQVQATLAGAGLCVLPAFIANREAELVAVLPDTFKLTRSFWMVVHSDHKDRARVKLATKFITDEVRRATATFRIRPGHPGEKTKALEGFAELHASAAG